MTESESAPPPTTTEAKPQAVDNAPTALSVKETNALTDAFTPEERAGVEQLRANLPDILPDGKPTKFWAGIVLDPVVKDAKADMVLVKFLRARELNVDAAAKQLKETLAWRAEFKPEDAAKEDFPAAFDKLGLIFGKDKGGRPITVNVYSDAEALKEAFSDVDRFLRWRIGLMEKSVDLLDFETTDATLQIHDYLGVSMSSRDANAKEAAKKATELFSAHYPELLYRKFFINVPAVFSWIFWLFKPILPAATFAKMAVVGKGKDTIGKELLPHVDADELPEQYGGKAKFDAVPSA